MESVNTPITKPKVIARVIEAGDCRYYRQGQEFILNGFTPKGVCDSAYQVLSRDAQTMRYGGKLPWQKEGRVLTRCPDPQGALWELRLEYKGTSEVRANAKTGEDEDTVSRECPH